MCVSPHKQLCQAAKATTAEYDADDDESKRYAVFDEDDDDPSGTTAVRDPVYKKRDYSPFGVRAAAL